jgi:hypothetical protein
MFIGTDSPNMTAAEDIDIPPFDKAGIIKTYKKSGTKESHGHAFYDGFRTGFAAAKNCE